MGTRSPLFFYLGEYRVGLSQTWLQQVIDSEVEGVELVLLEDGGGRRRRVVRLYIDHPSGVSHELCSRVSAAVGRALDEADVIDGPYVLEVSSPGLERPLVKRGHFLAQVGKKVHVKTKEPVQGGKVWRGTLLEVDEDDIVVEQRGRKVRIPLDLVASAHLIYEFK